jgi:transposase
MACNASTNGFIDHGGANSSIAELGSGSIKFVWRVVSGIVYVIRNGLQWKDAPRSYGKASKTRQGEPAGPEYGLVPSLLPNIRQLTRVEIPGGAYSGNHRSALELPTSWVRFGTGPH